MKSPFVTYYENIAKLSTVANKRTLFLAHMLYRMEYEKSLNMLVVDLTPRIKRQIISEISDSCKDPLNSAKQYISHLVKADLIKSIGSGAYTVDPSSYSYAAYVPKNLRDKASVVYNKIIHKDGEQTIETWVTIDGKDHQVSADGELDL